MKITTRARLLAGATLLLALAGAWHYLGSARADEQASGPLSRLKPAPTHASDLVTGSGASDRPQTVEEFLTAATTDVDAYWTKVFAASGLDEPRVSYAWIPAGQTAASACGGESGTLGDSAAAYCPGDDTIYISQQFATDIYEGALDHALPGSSQGYGGTAGDFAVAYIVAHEYGHQVQDELGLFDTYGERVPTMAFELQADCFAGTWAHKASERPRGRRPPRGARRRPRGRRLRRGQPRPPRHARAARGGVEARVRRGRPVPSCDRYLDPAAT